MIGRVIHERYRIQSLVAAGGQGRIYKAVQSGLGRTVIVKVLPVDPGRPVHDRQLERFMLEAARASRLTSPTTVPIFDYGRTDDGHHFVVMEDVEGITLARYLEREGRLSILPAVTIAGQVCLSLREAHALGVVHGNVEPNNIVLVNGYPNQVKVLDFGIIRPSGADDGDRELTSSRNELGAPEYMAPETIDGRADSRADIYSVGAVLYRSLTGRVPFRGKSATRTLLKATHDPVPAIDPHLGVPRAIEQVVMACLEKAPERRPRSVEDVLYALQVGVIEMHSAAHGNPPPATHIHAAIEPAVEGVIAADEPSAGAATPAPGWSTRATVKLLAAAVVLFAVGAAVSLIIRFSLSDENVVRPAPPPAQPERVAPAAGSTARPPEPPAAPTPAPAVNAEAPPPSELKTEGDDEDGRRRHRDTVRKRKQDRSSRSREPVPEGYKESPY